MRGALRAVACAAAAALGAAPASADTPACLAELFLQPARAVVGQAVEWRLEILRRDDVQEVDWLEPPGFPGFRAEWLAGDVDTRPLERGGRRYRVTRERRVLFPARAGPLRIPEAALYCDLEAADGRRRVRVPVAEAALPVAPLPDEGRPPGFTGLVGEVHVVTRLEPEVVALGGSAGLWILVQGLANLWAIDAPLREGDLPGAEVFAERPGLEIDAGRDLAVRRTFRYRLVPRRTGALEIPEVAIPYFDPATGRYALARGPARTLRVEPEPAPEP